VFLETRSPASSGRTSTSTPTRSRSRISSNGVGRQLLYRETKTESSEAILPLPDLCVTALKERRADQFTDAEPFGEVWLGDDFVFTTKFGTPIDPRNFNRSFAVGCARADVRPIRVHDARHTWATLLATLDVHSPIAVRITRHRQIAITPDVYTHVPSAETRGALERLGDNLGDENCCTIGPTSLETRSQ
jgi:integrase